MEILTETKTYIVLSFRISVKPEKVHTKTLKYLLYFSRYNSCDIPPPIMEGGEGGLTETEMGLILADSGNRTNVTEK